MSGRSARIAIVGGGAAGAFAALEFARLCPWAGVDLFERDGDPPGAGIVLSRQFVQRMQATHPDLFDLDEGCAVPFDRTLIIAGDTRIWTGAHGTLAVSRSRFRAHLLGLAAQAPAVTVRMCRQPGPPGGYDLVVAADGANSTVRRCCAGRFGTTATAGRNRFVWATTPVRLDPMFVLLSTGKGMLVVHAYPHAAAESTVIVESAPETLAAYSLLGEDADGVGGRLAAVFEPYLGGAAVRPQMPGFQRFVTLRNRQWSAGNVVLIGDAAHTVHFTTGSGTALAMDDAAALARHLAAADTIAGGVAGYAAERRPVLHAAYQDAASSERWFEQFIQRNEVHGARTAFALRTRRDLNGFDVLRERDPEFVAAVVAELAASARVAGSHGAATEPVDIPIRLGGAELPRRVIDLSVPGAAAASGEPGSDGWHSYPAVTGGRTIPVAVLHWSGDRGPEPAAAARAITAERRAGAAAVGVAVFDEPAASVVARAAPAPDFLAVPAQPGATRAERTELADRIRAASGLPIALWTPQPCGRDDANTLIAAGRIDLCVARHLPRPQEITTTTRRDETAMNESPDRLVRRYYDLLDEHRFADAAALFGGDGPLLWAVPGHGRMAGDYESVEAIRAALEKFHDGSFGTIKRDMHALCAAGDGDHVYAQYLLTMSRDGERKKAGVIDAWHVRGGWLKHVWSFLEDQYAFDEWTA
jgi:2-polyprenyl-6-methoxyphenol hydroxylase-like FAD-dependent oxidoreductase